MPEIEEEANTSSNAPPIRSCLSPGRQELANSMMKSATESVSKLKRGMMPTIYIVPQRIRQVNEVAYGPRMVSIGPYHNGNERLQGMEEYKWRYLHAFLSRNPNHQLEDYLKAIEELEDEARSCYSENVGPQTGNEFVKMMVLDACFIVELFLRFNWIKINLFLARGGIFLHTNYLEDPIFRTIGMRLLIGYDLLLLENQIPFLVLQRIFKMACPESEPRLLAEMALHFFHQFMPRNEKIRIEYTYHHLLHFFHSHLISTPEDPKIKPKSKLSCNPKIKPKLSCNPKIKLKPNLSCNPKIKLKLNLSCNPKIKPNLSCTPKIKLKPNLACNPKIKSVLKKLKNLLPCSNKDPLPITKPREMIPCATDLHLAGVKFKKNEKSNNILNVKFSHGVLEITPFIIHDDSYTLFRNLIAFEQCCLEAKFHVFTTYLVFMDCLVNTSKDVALLHQNGIIDNLLGSDDDVTHLFNRLSIGIFHKFEGSYLEDVHYKVQKHYQKKWIRWWVSLKRNYFTNPWSFISLIAASILLLLTITQTFFTVFPYLRPRS